MLRRMKTVEINMLQALSNFKTNSVEVKGNGTEGDFLKSLNNLINSEEFNGEENIEAENIPNVKVDIEDLLNIEFNEDIKTAENIIVNEEVKSDKNIEIKEYYKNIDDFLEELSHVNKISFTCKDDIFSTNSTQRKAYKDLTGNSSPTRFTLTFEYKDQLKPTKFIKSLNIEKENYRISSLIVQGYSKNNNIDLLFNTENLRERVTLNLDKTDEGIFKEEDVLNALQTKINH